MDKWRRQERDGEARGGGRRQGGRQWLMVWAGLLAVLARPAGAFACAVCFGDPDSDLVKGAAAGVWVLAGVIYGLLMCFGGFLGFCVVRVRRLEEANTDAPESGN